MFEIISGLLKYLFITVIYFFMFSIIRLIYLDIKHSRMGTVIDDNPYIKLMNRIKSVPFRVEESYSIKNKHTIGRGARSDIIIPDPFMSAVHAQFLKSHDIWTIVDNNSTNGTFVNGEQVGDEPCAIKTGDLIKIGQLMFVFVEPVFDEE